MTRDSPVDTSRQSPETGSDFSINVSDRTIGVNGGGSSISSDRSPDFWLSGPAPKAYNGVDLGGDQAPENNPSLDQSPTTTAASTQDNAAGVTSESVVPTGDGELSDNEWQKVLRNLDGYDQTSAPNSSSDVSSRDVASVGDTGANPPDYAAVATSSPSGMSSSASEALGQPVGFSPNFYNPFSVLAPRIDTAWGWDAKGQRGSQNIIPRQTANLSPRDDFITGAGVTWNLGSAVNQDSTYNFRIANQQEYQQLEAKYNSLSTQEVSALGQCTKNYIDHFGAMIACNNSVVKAFGPQLDALQAEMSTCADFSMPADCLKMNATASKTAVASAKRSASDGKATTGSVAPSAMSSRQVSSKLPSSTVRLARNSVNKTSQRHGPTHGVDIRMSRPVQQVERSTFGSRGALVNAKTGRTLAASSQFFNVPHSRFRAKEMPPSPILLHAVPAQNSIERDVGSAATVLRMNLCAAPGTDRLGSRHSDRAV